MPQTVLRIVRVYCRSADANHVPLMKVIRCYLPDSEQQGQRSTHNTFYNEKRDLYVTETKSKQQYKKCKKKKEDEQKYIIFPAPSVCVL